MINLLCFGDSNTFGTNPKGGRHAWNARWPGRLQVLSGPEYYVIQEGMGARTTVWDGTPLLHDAAYGLRPGIQDSPGPDRFTGLYRRGHGPLPICQLWPHGSGQIPQPFPTV